MIDNLATYLFLCIFIQLEKFEDVIAQTKKLQQENESLSFVVESKSKFERCVQPLHVCVKA